jgi:transposase-like protein
MSVMRRTHTREFKIDLCDRIALGSISKGAACREYNLAPSLLDRWCSAYGQKGHEAFKPDAPVDLERRVKELEASLGRAHMENEFLKEALGKLGIPVKRQP